MPLGPMNAPGGAVDAPPAFSMSTVTLPSGVTERTTLPCTSLNQSVPIRPPQRAFGELEAAGDLLDDGAGRDQRVERRIEPFDLADRVRRREPRPSRRGGVDGVSRDLAPPQPAAIRPASASTRPAVASTSRYTSSYSTTG